MPLRGKTCVSNSASNPGVTVFRISAQPAQKLYALLHKLHITIDPIEPDGIILRWMVSFKALDYESKRELGYRAWGVMNSDGAGLQFKKETQVHDADPERSWYEMPLDHRPDISAFLKSYTQYSTNTRPTNISEEFSKLSLDH